MSDFYLEIAQKENRTKIFDVRSLMAFYNDARFYSYQFDSGRLFICRYDDADIWSPYEATDKSVIVALSGRIAGDDSFWELGKNHQGKGGLACKCIFSIYNKENVEGLYKLNGGFSCVIIDNKNKIIHIVNDRTGMHPCFLYKKELKNIIFCSHPDILAAAAGCSDDIDNTSVAEFLVTGKLSFPNTYYNKIKSADYGCAYTIKSLQDEYFLQSFKYFNMVFNTDTTSSECELAHKISTAFKNAINRRTSPRFGTTAISLSGGLDSRMILCSSDNREALRSFCFFDEENHEYRIAKKIALTAGVDFTPFKRDFEHYGRNIVEGVRISGAMGDFGNNHYLGFREEFKSKGINNILAGFYCDYLFKGLVLDKLTNKWLRRERFGNFCFENYMPIFSASKDFDEAVKSRLLQLFPAELQADTSDSARLEIERRRIFPFAYEPDHMETIIPQRVMGWYLPIVDNDIIDLYLKIPAFRKLNTTLYSKAVCIQCGRKISNIENVNTGTRVDASWVEIAFYNNLRALKRKLKKKTKSIVSDESWPNWKYYVKNSRCIEELWKKKNSTMSELSVNIFGNDLANKNINEFNGRDTKLFLRLLTFKTWLESRIK